MSGTKRRTPEEPCEMLATRHEEEREAASTHWQTKNIGRGNRQHRLQAFRRGAGRVLNTSRAVHRHRGSRFSQRESTRPEQSSPIAYAFLRICVPMELDNTALLRSAQNTASRDVQCALN